MIKVLQEINKKSSKANNTNRVSALHSRMSQILRSVTQTSENKVSKKNTIRKFGGKVSIENLDSYSPNTRDNKI